MTNPVNIEFITEKMLEFLRGTTDVFLKEVLTKRICSVAERYAPNNAWYIRTITDLFEISGDMVQQEVAQNLMSLIAEELANQTKLICCCVKMRLKFTVQSPQGETCCQVATHPAGDHGLVFRRVRLSQRQSHLWKTSRKTSATLLPRLKFTHRLASF
jgi:hypothetical protein